MPGILDAYRGIDRTKAIQVQSYDEAAAEARRKQVQADALLRIQERQDERAQAEEGRKVEADRVKAQLPIATVDALGWMAKPEYQTGFAKAPVEARQHFLSAYDPAVAAEAPQIWDKAVERTTGHIPGLEDMEVKQANVGDDGKVTRTMVPKAAAEPQFDEFTTPQDVLAKLPQSESAMAQQIADYSLPINALSRIPAANKMRILSAAKVLNPDFDVKEFNNLNRARQAYSTGAQGQNIAAINTAIGHLGQLAKLSKQLDNGKFPIYNTVANEVSRHTGHPVVTQFEQTKEAVASELAKVFKGAGVTSEAQMREWRKALNSSMSPEQLREGIANAVHLMGSRVQEIDRQWDQLTKAPRDYRVLSEPNKRILEEIGFDPSELDPTGTATPAPKSTPEPNLPRAGDLKPAAPAKAEAPVLTDKAQFDALPSGAEYIRNGTRYRKP